MISGLLLPSVVRLATYSCAPCARGSRRILARQIMYSARLASLLPPRLRLCLTTLPEEASMGATPHRVAKEASLLNLSGRPRPRSTASRHRRCRCQARRSTPGRLLAPPADRGAPLARRSPSRGPRNNGGRRATERSANLV